MVGEYRCDVQQGGEERVSFILVFWVSSPAVSNPFPAHRSIWRRIGIERDEWAVLPIPAAANGAFPASVRRFKPPWFLSGQAASTSEAYRSGSARERLWNSRGVCLCRRCSRKLPHLGDKQKVELSGR